MEQSHRCDSRQIERLAISRASDTLSLKTHRLRILLWLFLAKWCPGDPSEWTSQRSATAAAVVVVAEAAVVTEAAVAAVGAQEGEGAAEAVGLRAVAVVEALAAVVVRAPRKAKRPHFSMRQAV